MTIKIDLSAKQTKDLLEYNQNQIPAIINAAQPNVIGADQFVFFAAFDGTNNDMNFHPSDKYDTNVGQLWSQYLVGSAGNANLGGGYYPGVGTKETLTQSAWNPAQVERQAIITAERAYSDFCTQAAGWLRVPENAGKSVSAVLTSFSRGGASAAIFSQLLYAKGLAGPKNGGKVLIPPGHVPVSAGALFDPVFTGVAGNLALAPNAKNILDIVAWNEYRQLFKGADYSSQPTTVTSIWMYGNHCDIGGSYDLGLSALALQAATGFLKRSGLSIADVPKARQFNASTVAVHSEEFDEYGNKIWDVYNSAGFSFKEKRFLEPVGTPAQNGGPFTMFNGTTVIF